MKKILMAMIVPVMVSGFAYADDVDTFAEDLKTMPALTSLDSIKTDKCSFTIDGVRHKCNRILRGSFFNGKEEQIELFEKNPIHNFSMFIAPSDNDKYTVTTAFSSIKYLDDYTYSGICLKSSEASYDCDIHGAYGKHKVKIRVSETEKDIEHIK